MGADLVIAVDLNHDIVANRVSHPDSRTKGKPYARTMTHLLTSLPTMESPVLTQFEAWLHEEPLPDSFDLQHAGVASSGSGLALTHQAMKPPISVRCLFDVLGRCHRPYRY